MLHKMRVFSLVVAALLVIGCLCESAPRLFVNPRPTLRKSQAFNRVYRTGLRVASQDETRFDEKLSVVLKESPLLSLQNSLTVAFAATFLAELSSVIPSQFQNKVRAQCCWIVVAVKLIDLYWSVDLADFSVRDNYEGNEVEEFAQKEVQSLVKHAPSKSLAYAIMCIVTGCPARCLLPFMITEIPTLLRVFGIVWITAFPGIEENPMIQALFGANDNDEPDNSAQVPPQHAIGACAFAGDAALLYGALGMIYNLVRSPAVGRPVRGIPDMFVFSVRLLLALQFTSLQLQQLTNGQSFQSMVKRLSGKNQMGRVLLNHPMLAEIWAVVLRVCASLQQVLTSNDKLRTLREFLGRHNIEVTDTHTVDKKTEAREKAVRDLNKNGEVTVINGVARRAVKKSPHTASTARKGAQLKKRRKKDGTGESHKSL